LITDGEAWISGCYGALQLKALGSGRHGSDALAPIDGFERRMSKNTMALLWEGDKAWRGVLMGMMMSAFRLLSWLIEQIQIASIRMLDCVNFYKIFQMTISAGKFCILISLHEN
jgi:hypothetical protein